jgi:hypothetical protein
MKPDHFIVREAREGALLGMRPIGFGKAAICVLADQACGAIIAGKTGMRERYARREERFLCPEN